MLLIVRPFLIGDHKRIEFMPVKDGMVDAFNKMMCFHAERFVYTSEKSDILLGYIKETKDYCKKFRSYRFCHKVIASATSSSPQAFGALPSMPPPGQLEASTTPFVISLEAR